MVVAQKETRIAYHCPHCNTTVFGLIGKFALAADMLRLKCPCGKSELTITYTLDKKVRLSVPCLFCATEHPYVISQNLFFERDLFLLNCPYTNMDICFIGEAEKIDEALEQNKAELHKLLEHLGLTSIEELRGESEDGGEDAEPYLSDAQIYDIIRFLVADLSEEGEITCPCGSGHYECEIAPHGIRVYCPECHAEHFFRAESVGDAQEFLHCSHIDLLQKD